MSSETSIELHADTLCELLTAQCADLEALLLLARHETVAAERDDFDRLVQIVQDRTELGERLEVYHRQIADMRQQMNIDYIDDDIAASTIRLIVEIQAQDRKTHDLLRVAQNETGTKLARLQQTQRGRNAYLREPPRGSVAYDQKA